MKLSVITLALLATTPAFADVSIGGTGQNVNIIGATTNINTSNTNINSAGSMSVTVNGGSGTMNVNAAQVVTGTQRVNGTATFLQAVNIGGAGVGAGLVGVGAGNKIVLNGNNGNATISGVTLSFGGTYVGPRADGSPALQVNGKGTIATGATDTTGAVSAANSTTIANGTDLTRISAKAATATAQVQTNLNAEVTTRTTEIARVDDRITEEQQARIDGDIAAIRATTNYTDNRVNAETQRAMQAERELSNHINAVGAMAMAVGSMPRTMYNPDRKSKLNLGIGNYGNATALAVGLSHDFNDRISGNLNVAQSITGNGNSGVGAGLSIGF
jgi:hypothetical protein